MIGGPAFEKLNKELMALLEDMNPRALDVIDELKRQGSAMRDDSLLGYAYYRYAYYYYFTAQDMRMFRVYLQQAIRYLLKADNKEYLAGAYNLVAYDAQDQGSFDIAYAYLRRAYKTAENEEGIALPGLIESGMGRVLMELGRYEEALERMKSSISKIEKFTDMHVYNYNMIISNADMALISFLMDDSSGMAEIISTIERCYQNASEGEITLSHTYYLLPYVYKAMMDGDDDELEMRLDELMAHWRTMENVDYIGLITEIETMFSYMLSHDYIIQGREMLEVLSGLEENENAVIAIRYLNLKIRYYEKIHDLKKLRESLRTQHEARKKQKIDTARMMRYSMEFADMTEEIAREREARLRGLA